jgi:site-specific DNA recombinase
LGILRAALYPRVSTEEQAKFGLSIHDQQADLETYAKENGMKIVGIYPDAGFSARKKIEKRPAMMELLAAVQRDEIDIILVTKLDRWFRNIGEYYKVQEILDAHNVCWKTIYEDYDTATAAGRLKINIMLAVAQDEADRTGERIKKVLDAKKERNEVCTGHLPKGYKIEGKFAVIDKEAEPDVNAFFKVFLETGSIHNAINAAPSLKLQYRTASKMLDNRGYVGEWHGLSIPPYLTTEEFDRIQTLRRRLQRKVAQNRTYIFSGLLVCGDCGRRIGGRPRKLVNGESYVYSCDGAYQYKGCPNHANIMENTIEQYLLETIDEKIKIFANTKEENKQNTKESEEKAKSLRKKLSKLSDLYLDDLISKDEYAKRYADLTEQLKTVETSLHQPPVKSAKKLSETFFLGWQDIYKELSRENKKAFWKLKLKEIRLYKDRRIDFDFL